MRHLLLVDDEPNILLGLQTMVERGFPEKYNIHLANDGLEVLEIIAKEQIDIIICDIRMPNMDGIELINQLQDMEHTPIVVILSGHGEFRYAKEAIRCGVKEYLLKPIVRGDLYNTLIRLEEELMKREALDQELRQSAEREQKLVESQLSNVLLNSSLDPKEARQMLSGIIWANSSIQVGIIKYMGNDSDSILLRLDGILNAAGHEAKCEFIRVLDQEGHIVIVSRPEFYRVLSGSFNGTKKQLHSFSLALSRATQGVERIREAYNEAKYVLRHIFLQNRTGVIVYDDITNRNVQYKIPLEVIDKIYNMLGTNREKELVETLYQIFGAQQVSDYSIDYFERVSSLLTDRVFDRVFQMYGKESIEILRLFKRVSSIANFSYFADYLHEIEELLLRLNEYVKSIKAVQVDNSAMKEAIRYISENYYKDINMATVSNAISLNYSYFSYAFKEYSGGNFVNYLRNIRINHAKEKLRSSNLKIYEIAKQVGFDNVKHFNRVFKKLEGISPQEFREQQRISRIE